MTSEIHYDLNSFVPKILLWRKQKLGISSIVRQIVQAIPILDEIHILCFVCATLDEQNIAVAQKEIRTCFNKYYNFEAHLGKRDYLTYIYKTYHVKLGTKIRPQPQNKRANRVTNEPKLPSQSPKNRLIGVSMGKCLSQAKMNDFSVQDTLSQTPQQKVGEKRG